MKHLKKYDNIDEIKYIGKYIIFSRRDKLYMGKVVDITNRVYTRHGDIKYFIKISELYPKIPPLKEIPIIKFYLEKMKIFKDFDTKKEAKNFYEMKKSSDKYNL